MNDQLHHLLIVPEEKGPGPISSWRYFLLFFHLPCIKREDHLARHQTLTMIRQDDASENAWQFETAFPGFLT